MAGAHDGHRSRMRERFRREGLNGFADHEALELMLFYAIPQRNVNPLAHALLERFGSFHAVLEAPAEQAEETARLLKETMEGAVSYDVAFVADTGIGGNWAEAH